MRNLLYIAAILIVGCSKPTMEDTFETTTNETNINTATDTSSTTTTSTTTKTAEQAVAEAVAAAIIANSLNTIAGGSTSTTTSQTAVSTGTRIEGTNGYVMKVEVRDTKDQFAGYEYTLYPNDGYRLAAFTRLGTGVEYSEDDVIETTEELEYFIFSRFITFEYKGRTFNVEESQIERRVTLEREWDLARSYATGDLLDYENRFVILQPRGYYFGARAAQDYTIYAATWAFEAGVILHEIAHVWSNQSPVIDWNAFAILMADNHVSNYGATALSEYIAEAVSHYLLPSHTVPKAIDDLLTSYGL